MESRLFSFVGENTGTWTVLSLKAIVGESIPMPSHLEIVPGKGESETSSRVLRGIRSHDRYVTGEEKTALAAKQEGLGRPTSVCAALIPINKNPAWWILTQDERRAIFEEQSGHNKIGMQYLPAIARRLYHCRDLSENEPFDFLTWFEYAPADATAFDDLLAQLRSTLEWTYVSREVDLRLEKR
jgi:chlorite dismutase